MSTIQQLTEVFNDNFVAYFRSHIAHLNVRGRNFYSDHKLLGKIYEDLQGQIDVIGELIRSMGELAPDSIQEVAGGSSVLPLPVTGDADQLLTDVRNDLLQLKICYTELIHIADEEDLLEISNYAQDRVLALEKFVWMIDSTLS